MSKERTFGSKWKPYARKTMEDYVPRMYKDSPNKHINMESVVGYTPFKMKAKDHDNSPAKKNFGVGTSEFPEKESTSPGKFGVSAFMSRGMPQAWKQKIANQKGKTFMGVEPNNLDPAGEAGKEGAAAEAEAMEAAEGGEEAGAVPKHGP